MSESKKKLTSLDDLFGLNTETNKKVDEVAIINLIPFRNHPFKLYTDKRLDDMVTSVKEMGVLVPLLVREIESTSASYEILSGHNRWNAAKLAGLKSVPVRIMKDIDEDFAMLIVTETNLIQRSFGDLLPSERACVLSEHYKTIKSQGKRVDLINQINELLNTDEMGNEPTSGHDVQKLNSREKTARNYDMSSRTVARYLRINELNQKLKDYLDEEYLSMTVCIEISYLNQEYQSYLAGFLDAGKKIDLEKAQKLRNLQKNSRLNEINMEKVLDGTYSPRKSKSVLKGIKIKPNIMKKYFKEEQTIEEVSNIIDEALEFYYKSRQGGL